MLRCGMASLCWLLFLFIVYLQGYVTQTIYECEELSTSNGVCTIQSLQLTSPKDIYQIELPMEQQFVHLVNGNIPDFGKQIYEQLEETTNLTITNCNVGQLFIGYLLVHLNASNNQLTRVESSKTDDYSALKVLDLSHNKLARVPNVKTFTQLEVLELSNNAIELLLLDVLEPLGNLRLLNLANNRIQSLVSRIPFHLQSLTELRLSNNSLPEFTADDWVLPALSNIDLSYNHLFYLNSDDLQRACPNLSQINLAGNQWNCRGLSTLQHFLNNRSISSPSPPSCDESYLGYVTLQTQWDIRKLRHDMRTMNDTLVADLAQVRSAQAEDIGALERQLTAQEHAMGHMRDHLVRMTRLVENLLEELLLRQAEAELGKQKKQRPAMLIY